MGPWLNDLESLERVSQDAFASRLVLRLAQLCREGKLDGFVIEIAHSDELDAETRSAIAELAEDESFLLAVEEYLGRTAVQH